MAEQLSGIEKELSIDTNVIWGLINLYYASYGGKFHVLSHHIHYHSALINLNLAETWRCQHAKSCRQGLVQLKGSYKAKKIIELWNIKQKVRDVMEIIEKQPEEVASFQYWLLGHWLDTVPIGEDFWREEGCLEQHMLREIGIEIPRFFNLRKTELFPPKAKEAIVELQNALVARYLIAYITHHNIGKWGNRESTMTCPEIREAFLNQLKNVQSKQFNEFLNSLKPKFKETLIKLKLTTILNEKKSIYNADIENITKEFGVANEDLMDILRKLSTLPTENTDKMITKPFMESNSPISALNNTMALINHKKWLLEKAYKKISEEFLIFFPRDA